MPKPKLTDEQVKEIREMISKGYRYEIIGARYGVSKSMISKIKLGWRLEKVAAE